MEKKFKMLVNDDFEFSFDGKALANLDIQQEDLNLFHILKDQKSYKAKLEKSSFLDKTYWIKINSTTYKVAISSELDILIEDMGLSLSAAETIKDIKAPMPGLILEVAVKEGDKVTKGDYLLILEAMKMENSLTAPRDGIVKKVLVEKGDKVDKNQVLVEME